MQGKGEGEADGVKHERRRYDEVGSMTRAENQYGSIYTFQQPYRRYRRAHVEGKDSHSHDQAQPTAASRSVVRCHLVLQCAAAATSLGIIEVVHEHANRCELSRRLLLWDGVAFVVSRSVEWFAAVTAHHSRGSTSKAAAVLWLPLTDEDGVVTLRVEIGRQSPTSPIISLLAFCIHARVACR